MIRGTTPTHTFDLPVEANNVKNIRITYIQRREKIVEKKMDAVTFENKKVKVTLTQKETLKFEAKHPALVQVRILTTDGRVLASDPEDIHVEETFNEEILS